MRWRGGSAGCRVPDAREGGRSRRRRRGRRNRAVRRGRRGTQRKRRRGWGGCWGLRESGRLGLVVRGLKSAALRRVRGGGSGLRRGRLGWGANPFRTVALISRAVADGREGAVAVLEEGGGSAAGGFGVVRGFEDVAQTGDGLDFGVGEHVAGAEFEERGDARDEGDDAVFGHEGGELGRSHVVHAAQVGHVIRAVEPVVDEFEFFVGEVCGHGCPLRGESRVRGEKGAPLPNPPATRCVRKNRGISAQRRRDAEWDEGR